MINEQISMDHWKIVDPDHIRVRTEQTFSERLGELMKIEEEFIAAKNKESIEEDNSNLATLITIIFFGILGIALLWAGFNYFIEPLALLGFIMTIPFAIVFAITIIWSVYSVLLYIVSKIKRNK